MRFDQSDSRLFDNLMCFDAFNVVNYVSLIVFSVSSNSLSFLVNDQQKGLELEITRRTLTHTSWDLSSSREHERRGWHPLTYKLADATPTLVQSIKV